PTLAKNASTLSISEVARRVGLRPSAIRYYEKIGILQPPWRVSGQRRYGPGIIHRLAVLKLAQQVRFTLTEIPELLSDDGRKTVSERWQKIAVTKLAYMNAQLARIESMKEVLRRLQDRCQCDSVDRCGALINGQSRG